MVGNLDDFNESVQVSSRLTRLVERFPKNLFVFNSMPN